ncbi:alpha/beta fold hydrolase [Glycomyces tritici]|uniref:Alpha/beta hydrolase n=1 Tax=Glycomyces tritici TaxID=2665176 RepID=A0ABT7YSQ4_9ACTN|nr:alpha/beta hydrolase [Glycomyces tritici]MDN3241664.1 alpha/beta hydrolase [Glycomyces tritici]
MDNTNSPDATLSAWSGMVPLEDTALAVHDTGGTGRPVVYLNGSYANHKHWRKVIADLGSAWRHLTFDERARGDSQRSADYSFEACLRDIDAVLEARNVDRPLLVGWSYGAVLAVHWAARNPDRAAGVVSVDGAYPWGLTGEANREYIRRTFHQMRLALPLARPLGMAARMSAAQHAEINIELNEIVAGIEPVYGKVTCPVRFIVASGGNTGGSAESMEAMRATLGPVLAAHPNVQVSAKVASNHEKVLRNDSGAVADAVREISAILDQEVH